jgi:hypothetical protein
MIKAKSSFQVRKNTGDLVPFDAAKLGEALRRSGASESETNSVIRQVTESLYEGITTKKIYQLAYSILRKLSNRSAGRYKLKKALMELGPTGFPFEQYMSRLLEIKGYSTKTGQIINGMCVRHEVDVVASKQGELIMAECKYHQAEGVKSDVKVSMYVHSRFEDIKHKMQEETGNKNLVFVPMLITNTRFTDDAIQFGECSGLKLISWDYPIGHGLKEWIDQSRLYPITVLKSITKAETAAIMETGIVLCKEIVNHPDVLDRLHIPKRRMDNILEEAQSLIR